MANLNLLKSPHPQVRPSDAGRYLCTLETFPKQSLITLLQVNGEYVL